MAFQKVVLLGLFTFALSACKSGGSSGAASFSLDGVYVAPEVYQALQDDKGGAAKYSICQNIRNEYEADNFEYLTVSLFESGKFYDCKPVDSWRSSCTEVGTYSGNKVTLKENGSFELSKPDEGTIVMTRAWYEGKEVNINDVYENESDRTAKKISHPQVETLISLLKDCGIFL